MCLRRMYELRDKTGCSLDLCVQAVVYSKNHAGCTPLGYLKAKTLAVATLNVTFEQRVRMFSKEEENE